MDAIEILKHDHRMVEQLFRDYDAAASDGQRLGVVRILIRELSKHAAVEELMFYPFAKRVIDDGEKGIAEQLAEHTTVKKLLVELDKVPESDDRTAEVVRQLNHSVGEHIHEEEDELMPKVRAGADEEALEELGEHLDKAKSTAPTRPHPHAPDEPPLLAMAAPLAAIYDRLRDRLQGRPQT
jgi:hemerythrin superfamily protein